MGKSTTNGPILPEGKSYPMDNYGQLWFMVDISVGL